MLAEKIISAFPYFFNIFLLNLYEKKSLIIFKLFFFAFLHAIFEGSTPRCLIFLFLKFCKNEPSFEPISNKKFLSFKLIFS